MDIKRNALLARSPTRISNIFLRNARSCVGLPHMQRADCKLAAHSPSQRICATFEDGLRNLFQPCYDPPTADMKKWIAQLRESPERPREE
jgi:hypothetical protein